MIQIQLRSEENGFQYITSLKTAFELAKKDKTIWKISFSVGEERLRLIRENDKWVVEQMDLVELASAILTNVSDMTGVGK